SVRRSGPHCRGPVALSRQPAASSSSSSRAAVASGIRSSSPTSAASTSRSSGNHVEEQVVLNPITENWKEFGGNAGHPRHAGLTRVGPVHREPQAVHLLPAPLLLLDQLDHAQ